ncbi:MAG: PP2C family protein-serine/threonine phosphatase [Terracidiphilus sp.]
MTARPFRPGLPSPARFCLALVFCLALAGLALTGVARPLRAQSPRQTASPGAAPSAPSAASPAGFFDATALQAPAPVYALWLVKAGDDPAFASPAFDDSQWTRIDPSAPLADFIHGKPTILWYRLHVKVSPSQFGLALEEWNLGPAFEIYVNGRLFQRNGSVAPFSTRTYDARLIRRIPAADIASGSLLIALRIHISPGDWLSLAPALFVSNSGKDPMENLSIGQFSALRDRAWLSILGQSALSWINIWGGFGLGIVALALFLSQRNQWEYLWIFLQFLADALLWPTNFFRLFHTLNPAWVVAQVPLRAAHEVFLILMFFAFLRRPLGRWIKLILVFGILSMAVAQGVSAYHTFPSVAVILALFPLLFLICGLIPFLLALQWRRGSREAGILLIPALLTSLSIDLNVLLYFVDLIPALRLPVYHAQLFLNSAHIGPFQVTLNDTSISLYILSLAIIMVLRSTLISRQQAILESEMAAAREVQQVILPEQVETIPGFSVESVYQPAQQVGGDFFQVLPDGQGGLLVVVGDVAGKGLPAAMLVSVLVGAIRTAAAYGSNPAEILAQLNQRLVGRGHGSFSTALAARIAPDGLVTLANAGHLSPYLDGREIDLPGALPLGVKANAHYETVTFRLAHSSRLTFYSDGVVEAQNRQGELLGFERGKALSTRPAAEIVEAASAFGQADDITVVAIARAPMLEAIPA